MRLLVCGAIVALHRSFVLGQCSAVSGLHGFGLAEDLVASEAEGFVAAAGCGFGGGAWVVFRRFAFLSLGLVSLSGSGLGVACARVAGSFAMHGGVSGTRGSSRLRASRLPVDA